ncbi:MAG: type II secretion system F family protein [Candidatus Micrarchaeota archaeon]
MLEHLFIPIARLFGQGFITNARTKLSYAGISTDAEVWLGSAISLPLFVSLFGAAVTYLMVPVNKEFNTIIVFSGVLMLTLILGYIEIFFKIANRVKKVEAVLPDFLLLIGSNLRAGMTPYSAFMSSARPEFNPLYEEVKKLSNVVSSKTSLGEALYMLTNRFDSQILRKTIGLFSKGSKSGAHLADLLFSNAEEIRKIHELRQELISSTRSYSVFLAFIVVFVMPFLLSISIHFLTVFSTIQEDIGISGDLSAGVIIFSGQVGITSEEMLAIASITLALTTFFASLLMGVINTGKALYGIKYFFIMLLPAFVFFFFAQQIIQSTVPF